MKVSNIIVILCFIVCSTLRAYDVTIVGCVDDASRVTQQTLDFVSCLSHYKDIKLDFVKAGTSTLNGVPQYITSFTQRGIDLPIHIKLCGCCCERIALFADGLLTSCFENLRGHPYKGIRLVFVMPEQAKIQKIIVSRFNNFFDAVIVSDEKLIDEYKKMGIKLPIFFLPVHLAHDHIRQKCLNLVKPKKLLMGNEDSVTDEILITQSKDLYDKYVRFHPASVTVVPTIS